MRLLYLMKIMIMVQSTTVTSLVHLLVISALTSYKDITCHGENNGSIGITVSGANGAVTYLWE